jgi:hypothetical protein
MALVVVATSQTLVIRRLAPGKRTQDLGGSLRDIDRPGTLQDLLVTVGVDLLDVVSAAAPPPAHRKVQQFAGQIASITWWSRTRWSRAYLQSHLAKGGGEHLNS